jgi:hypothetical protein
MLLRVQAKGRPACFKPWPRNDGVATKKDTFRGPIKREMPGRMSGRMHHVKRTDPVTLMDVLIDLAGRVLSEAERRAELEGEIRSHRPLGDDCHRLGCSFTPHDIRFPFVSVDASSCPVT